MSKFAIKISIWNVVGYCLAVGGPTIIDPLLEHHVLREVRSYPLGVWVFAPAVLVGLSTYWFNIRNWSSTVLGVFTFVSLLVISYATLPNFTPGFPHHNVLLVPIYFGLVTGLGSYIHHFRINLEFLNTYGHYQAKTERLKMEHEAWFKFIVALVSLYVIATLYLSLSLTANTAQLFSTTSSIAETDLLRIAYTILIILNCLAFITCPLWELGKKTSAIRALVTDMYQLSKDR